MDFSKLSQGAKIALVAAAVLVINLFLPWYSIDVGITSVSANALDAGFLAWGGSLIAVAGGVVLLMKAMGTRETDMGSLKTEQIALLLGALGLVLIVLRWLTETSFVSFGLFLGVIAAAAVTYGAFMEMKAAGLDMPDLDDFKSVVDGDDDE